MGSSSVISFGAVMSSALTRRSFYAFLQDEGQHDLLGFWSAVEELRRADRTLWHQLATEIFYGYVNKPTDDGAGVQGKEDSMPSSLFIHFHYRSFLLFSCFAMLQCVSCTAAQTRQRKLSENTLQNI